ncbi:MAG: cupin domain-containing protein [Treponema sp.]|nr:cupin domain-containing protein [Treponema sp.]
MTSMQNKRKPYRFGEKLRQVRERKGMTLKSVAQEAGVSESLISQIERNRVSPAIDTLLALTDVLDINLEYLFDEYKKERPVYIVRRETRRVMEEKEVVYEELSNAETHTDHHEMETYIVNVPVGGHTHRGNYGHYGHETGFILSGTGELHYHTSVYQLNEGDSVTFSSSAPHSLANIGDKPLKAIWVVTPPNRFIRS